MRREGVESGGGNYGATYEGTRSNTVIDQKPKWTGSDSALRKHTGTFEETRPYQKLVEKPYIVSSRRRQREVKPTLELVELIFSKSGHILA